MTKQSKNRDCFARNGRKFMIHIVTALMHEAKPLIDFYHLKPIQTHPYKIYQNENFSLIVSGVGKKQSATATAHLHEYTGKIRNRTWLNIGIGGHSKENLGEGVLAHKITDQANGKSWYPPRILKIACPSKSILTVEKVELNYDGDFVYDMEAAGFYETASRFSTQELIHSFKIISDNSNISAQKVSGSLVRDLVAQNLNLIDSIVKELSKLSDELIDLNRNPEALDQFLKQWHFTVTESHRLKQLLNRLKTLEPNENWFANFMSLRGGRRLTKQSRSEIASASLESQPRNDKFDAKKILKFLERQIETLPVYL